MKDIIMFLFGYLVFFYSASLVASYIAMCILAYFQMRNSYNAKKDPLLMDDIKNNPNIPGVSIVAGAYNEGAIVVECVESFLHQDYPLYEVVIVNDGSTDNTLELMIEHFDLVESDEEYIVRIPTKPFKRLFRSTNPQYSNLKVVDKVNGGTKSDSINAGLNAAQYPYFINTDVDCILSYDAIIQCIRPILEDSSIIAVSGAMAMNNGCTVSHGHITQRNVSHKPVPLFQSVEYLRSYFLGKMAWSQLNAMPNVSGGYGLFDTQLVISAGGYNPTSFAEDMDMLIRMVTYCCHTDRKYRVVQIPATCCWTQGPPNYKVLSRQRVRWGRGLIQTFHLYSNVVFNRKYRQMGTLTLPYVLIFEFAAPIIEFVGLLTFIYLAVTGAINWITCIVMLSAIILFGVFIATITFLYDFLQERTYGKNRAYLWMFLACILEPVFYHPFVVFCSLRGYYNYILNTRAVWGAMTRDAINTQSATNKKSHNPEPAPSIVSNPEPAPSIVNNIESSTAPQA